MVCGSLGGALYFSVGGLNGTVFELFLLGVLIG